MRRHATQNVDVPDSEVFDAGRVLGFAAEDRGHRTVFGPW